MGFFPTFFIDNICDTARSVLALSPADIASRADLEDETVEEVFGILRAEFEEE